MVQVPTVSGAWANAVRRSEHSSSRLSVTTRCSGRSRSHGRTRDERRCSACQSFMKISYCCGSGMCPTPVAIDTKVEEIVYMNDFMEDKLQSLLLALLSRRLGTLSLALLSRRLGR